MSSTTDTQLVAPPRRARRISRGTVLVLGVLVIPFVLSVALNSYGALTTESALRMAFASVAGQTIAILSAVTAVVLTIVRRYAVVSIIGMAGIAGLITLWAVGAMQSAGVTLLSRLELIEQVAVLNG